MFGKITIYNIIFLVFVFNSLTLKVNASNGFTLETDPVKLYTFINDTILEGQESYIIEHQNTDTKNNQDKVAANINTDVSLNLDSLIEFYVSTSILYLLPQQFRTPDGKIIFYKGKEIDNKLSVLISSTDSLRTIYQSLASLSEKEALSSLVLTNELEIIKLKSEIDDYYTKAREKESAFWMSAPENEYKKVKRENDSITNLKTLLLQPKIEEKTELLDTISIDSMKVEVATIPVVSKPENKVVYKIQIGNYNTKLPAQIDKLFKKIAVLRKIDTHLDEKGSTVYTIGELLTLNDAVKLQNQIRQEGVKDAFVIAIYNGKRITLNEAKELGAK